VESSPGTKGRENLERTRIRQSQRDIFKFLVCLSKKPFGRTVLIMSPLEERVPLPEVHLEPFVEYTPWAH
jgi:hypothetical protein